MSKGTCTDSVLKVSTADRNQHPRIPRRRIGTGLIVATLTAAGLAILHPAIDSFARSVTVAEPITTRPAFNRFAFAGAAYTHMYGQPAEPRIAVFAPDKHRLTRLARLPFNEKSGIVDATPSAQRKNNSLPLPPARTLAATPATAVAPALTVATSATFGPPPVALSAKPATRLEATAGGTAVAADPHTLPTLETARAAPMVAGWIRLPEIATETVEDVAVEAVAVIPEIPLRRPSLPARYLFLLERAAEEEREKASKRQSSRSRKTVRRVERKPPVRSKPAPAPKASAPPQTVDRWKRRAFGFE